MSLNVVVYLIFIFFYKSVNSVSYVTPCKWDDSKCLKLSAQAAVPVLAAGIPDIGVPSSDPMLIEHMHSDAGGLNLTLNNVVINGLSQCQINNIRRNIGKSTLFFEKVSGKLVIFPIDGQWNFGITADKVKINVKSKLNTETGADGKEHWQIEGRERNYDALDRVVIKIENLFDGDERQAAPVLKFINESWRVFIAEIGKPFVDKVLTSCVDNINKLFSAIPVDELEKV